MSQRLSNRNATQMLTEFLKFREPLAQTRRASEKELDVELVARRVSEELRQNVLGLSLADASGHQMVLGAREIKS